MLKDNKDHDLYELHKKYRLTPVEARDSVNILKEMGILTTQGNTFKISSNISYHSMSLLYKKTRYRKLNLDEDILEKMKGAAVSHDEPYLPNLKIIDRKLKCD